MLPAYHPNAAHLLLSPLQRSTSYPLIVVPNTTHLPLQSTTPIDYHPPTAIHLPLHLLLPPPLQSTYLSLICYLLPSNSPAVSTTINHLLPTYCCFQYHHKLPLQLTTCQPPIAILMLPFISHLNASHLLVSTLQPTYCCLHYRTPTTTTNHTCHIHTATHLPLQSTCHHPSTSITTTTATASILIN